VIYTLQIAGPMLRSLHSLSASVWAFFLTEIAANLAAASKRYFLSYPNVT